MVPLPLFLWPKLANHPKKKLLIFSNGIRLPHSNPFILLDRFRISTKFLRMRSSYRLAVDILQSSPSIISLFFKLPQEAYILQPYQISYSSPFGCTDISWLGWQTKGRHKMDPGPV